MIIIEGTTNGQRARVFIEQQQHTALYREVMRKIKQRYTHRIPPDPQHIFDVVLERLQSIHPTYDGLPIEFSTVFLECIVCLYCNLIPFRKKQGNLQIDEHSRRAIESSIEIVHEQKISIENIVLVYTTTLYTGYEPEDHTPKNTIYKNRQRPMYALLYKERGNKDI